MKRKLESEISEEFLKKCQEEFRKDPINIIARNAINSVGSMLGTINSNRVNQISHVFLNSVKKPYLKATNQGASGRCWMFAALNTFRHMLINALNLENFEFSETYLFFWDKLERANSYIHWFIDHPDQKSGDRTYDYIVENSMCDGGWWCTFANLVQKYGLIPASAMKETYQSDDSEDMNRIIKDQLDCCVNYIRKHRNKFSLEELEEIRKSTVQEIYNTLVKFLGEPPQKFDWSFSTDENEPGVISKLSPMEFLGMVAPEMDMNADFVTLANIPKGMKFYKNYKIKYTNNVYEGENFQVFNLPIDEMSRYAVKSISSGMSVWFACDVMKSFNWVHSTLDDKLDDHKIIFEEEYKFEKGERLQMGNVQPTHAMALTGFNMDDKGKVVSWQVENSWGYSDNETPGLDGFLCMSQSWFEKYVIMIVVHKRFLSRTLQNKVETEAIELEPWSGMAPALRIKSFRKPV
jgi:bleomycin hydrolase